MAFIYLPLRFLVSLGFCMLIINGSYTKSKPLQSLDFLLKDVIIYCCVICLGRKYCRWNHATANTWTNKLNSFTQRMSKFYLLFYYCDSWKFNLISGFFISLFMVTGGKVIFICSPEAHLSESITSEILKLGGSFLFQNVQNLM